MFFENGVEGGTAAATAGDPCLGSGAMELINPNIIRMTHSRIGHSSAASGVPVPLVNPSRPSAAPRRGSSGEGSSSFSFSSPSQTPALGHQLGASNYCPDFASGSSSSPLLPSDPYVAPHFSSAPHQEAIAHFPRQSFVDPMDYSSTTAIARYPGFRSDDDRMVEPYDLSSHHLLPPSDPRQPETTCDNDNRNIPSTPSASSNFVRSWNHGSGGGCGGRGSSATTTSSQRAVVAAPGSSLHHHSKELVFSDLESIENILKKENDGLILAHSPRQTTEEAPSKVTLESEPAKPTVPQRSGRSRLVAQLLDQPPLSPEKVLPPSQSPEEERSLSQLNEYYEMDAPDANNFTSYMDGVGTDSYRKWLAANCYFKKTVLWQLNHIQKTWSNACRRIDLDPTFLQALLAFHSGKTNALDKDLIKSHIISLTKVYRDFAWQQPEFALLATRLALELVQTQKSGLILILDVIVCFF